MNIRSHLKWIWLVVGVISLLLLAFDWFSYGSQNLQNSILALNVLALILSLPCSLFVIPVLLASNHFMALSPFSNDGVYLNTILLFIVGAMQWFWIAKFWSPTEPQLQELGFGK